MWLLASSGICNGGNSKLCVHNHAKSTAARYACMRNSALAGIFKFDRDWQAFVSMPKSYLENLRWRAVWLHIVQGMTYQEISKLLYMSERSIQRYMERFHATGSVAPTA